MKNQIKPKWLRSVENLLPVKSQFILSGNIRDKVWINNSARSFYESLWLTLESLGYECLLVWDMVNHFSLYPPNPSAELRNRIINYTGIGFDECGFAEVEICGLSKYVELMANPRNGQGEPIRLALLIDYASRLQRDSQSPTEDVRQFFVAAEKASLIANPMNNPPNNEFLFNPVFWILNQGSDLPFWLTASNDRIHSIPLSLPNSDIRKSLAEQIYVQFSDDNKDISRSEFSELLARRTHNMSLRSVDDIVKLALNKNMKASDIEEAVLSYRVGDTDLESPWRADNLKNNIAIAEDPNSDKYIEKRVKGQTEAVSKALDIIKRSSIGLTGAQSGKAGSRPRGVMFFVGPTGVGKTELAKAIAEMVFGDEESLLRFDMSEFSQEHSGDRLIGAPPGYVGFDQGGELTTAMRENPFRVVLFDEIEKAHHRILDKFLQILEDGRLTDGRGETAYFSESLIIFTSNLGISRLIQLANGTYEYEKILSYEIAEGLKYIDYEEKLMSGVEEYFKTRLQRPELLNRFGENFLAFNYIEPQVALDILNGMLENVIKRVKDEHSISIKLEPEVLDKIQTICAKTNLDNGGRGIGNKLEDCLVNPLARELFPLDFNFVSNITLTELEEENGNFRLVIDAS